MELLLAKKYHQTRYVILIAFISATLQFLLSYGSVSTTYNIIFMAGLVPITLVTCLVFVHKLIPKYVLTNQLVPFVTWSLATFLGSAVLTLSFLIMTVGLVPGLTIGQMPNFSRNYPFLMTAMFSIVILVSFLSLWKHRQLALVDQINLQKKLSENDLLMKRQELDALKSQLHPHFLFNSLNTIYSLALRKSKETPETILKLSDLLDYILYQVNQPRVALKKEIDHISDYMDLEKTRFEDNLEVILEAKTDRDDYEIAPMLLMPFIENAFKHGKTTSSEQFVKTQLTVNQNLLTFSLENSCLDKTYKAGLGLKNIQKRLEILYPNRYGLNIHQEAGLFKVNLEIRGLKPTIDE